MAGLHALDVAGRRTPSRHVAASSRSRRAGWGWRRVAVVALLLVVAAVGGEAAALWSGGVRMYVVHTGSMTPTYRPGDIVIDRPVAAPPRPGEVLTFRHSDRTTDVVTHRVVARQPDGELTTKGDANPSDDAWSIRPSQVQGQVILGLRYAGYLAVYLQQPAGIASLATTVLAVILLWQLFFSAAGRPEPVVADGSL